MKNNNALIIGIGGMGQRYYAILKKLKFNKIDIVENNPKKINEATHRFKIKKGLISKNICKEHLSTVYNLVIISTTTDKKFYFFKQIASKKTKNIFFEKPLARSLVDCKRIKIISKKYKIRVGINHQLRHTNQLLVIKNIVKKIGNQKLLGLNIVAGNIGIAMNGIHAIEIFNYLADSNINKISAILEKKKVFNSRGKKFLDISGNVFCRNKSNQTLNISTSTNQKHGYLMIFNYTSGYVFLNYLNGYLYGNFRKKKFLKFDTGYYGLPSLEFKKRVKLSDLETSTKKNLLIFLQNKKNFTSLNNAIDSIKVLVSIYKSSYYKGKEIDINKIKSNQIFKWA